MQTSLTDLLRPVLPAGLASDPVQSRPVKRWQVGLSLLGLAVALSAALYPVSIRAESPETAPAQLKETLAKLDGAANSHNLQAVLQFYSPTFSHSDGLTRTSLEQALKKLWGLYPDLKYRTEIKSWKVEGKNLVVQTVTYITGTQKASDREFKIASTMEIQQQFENQKIVRQEVLSERSQITSGNNPPTVLLKLPEQVLPGQQYSMDAIVQEPLGNDLLLGAAVEEPVKVDAFVNPAKINLRPLIAGGIFKVGKAPTTGNSRWVSAVLIRRDGMTVVTQRLRVVNRKK